MKFRKSFVFLFIGLLLSLRGTMGSISDGALLGAFTVP